MRSYRVLLAPLRFGAGLKGKVVDAWAHGLPVFTTPVGAEGMFGEPDDAQVHVGALACYRRLFEAQAPRFHQVNRVLLGSEREAVVRMPYAAVHWHAGSFSTKQLASYGCSFWRGLHAEETCTRLDT